MADPDPGTGFILAPLQHVGCELCAPWLLAGRTPESRVQRGRTMSTTATSSATTLTVCISKCLYLAYKL